ncbi:MAG: polyphosphate kinase [Acidimicrobiales bacterium]|nr:MAG: polyphosphate kinase [Acidimicrobiales bacterium]
MVRIKQAVQMDHSPYLVPTGQPVDLRAWTTDDDGGLDKRAAKDRTDDLNDRIEALQELLFAEGRHKVLVIIQATDTGGKDGTIRHVFDKVNPQGVKVASFKKPTEEELGHDYLWRVHRHAPKSGEITIFNRSHYEDVLVVRVHDLVPPEQWERRYEHINAFERLLTDEGTTIVKLFLHISKDEQRERLQDRLDEADKNWKFDSGDLRERAHWDQYQEAFRVMLERTSTVHAPWYVIPADRKWFRNLLVSEIIAATLEQLDMAFPPAEEGIRDLVIE